MKKFIAIALLTLFATACTPTENAGMMNKGMMCEKCPCCQKMIEGGMMKEGMQCPMMQGKSKDGMKCGCCQGMMGGEMKKQSTPAAKESTFDHNAHHPAQ
jgi:hypothetical protein